MELRNKFSLEEQIFVGHVKEQGRSLVQEKPNAGPVAEQDFRQYDRALL